MEHGDLQSNWTGTDLLFVDQRREHEGDPRKPDEHPIENADLNRCIFENVKLKGRTIRCGRVVHSKFRNCYFRDATFERVELTGCEFVNCNLRKVKFKNCYLDYVRFKDCVLPYDLPTSCNVQYGSNERDLVHQLRIHAQEDGSFREGRRLLLAELRLDRLHEWKKAFDGDQVFYRKEFQGWDRVRGFRAWIIHLIEGSCWGYGLYPSRLLVSALSLAVFLSSCIWFFSLQYKLPEGSVRALGFGEAMYFTVVTFTTLGYGDIVPISFGARCVTLAACISGALLLGLVAASMFKRMER